MAANFRILIHWSSESLHLKLIGDFDETSAEQLSYTVKKNGARVGRIFVHTNCLGTIYPASKVVFQSKLSAMPGGRDRLIFTGEKGAKIAPAGSKLL
jgi:hypothetical protein